MKIESQDPVATCGLEEFFRDYWEKQADRAERLSDVEETLRGDRQPKPRFRIPAADNGLDLFFENRELLCRWANMPTPMQERFLLSIRQVLRANGVKTMRLLIPWAKTSSRFLEIHASGGIDGHLDFILLNFS